MAAAHTGEPWDADAVMQLGKEALTYERLFNEHAGFTNADDRLPKFFYEEPLEPHNAVFTVSDEELDSVFSFVPETAKQLGIS
jgi:aldehyde:ferredoxin oxidoreductase